MVLTPRLRSHIADPSAMETDMSPEPSVCSSTRKRHRSLTFDSPPDLPNRPELPKLSGEIILDVFTHASLRRACNATYQDNERLSILGHYILDMITTQLLFYRKPKLRKETIEVSQGTQARVRHSDSTRPREWHCYRMRILILGRDGTVYEVSCGTTLPSNRWSKSLRCVIVL